MSLYSKLSSSIQLGEEKKNELIRAINNGEEFFRDFNSKRMQLAFSLFSSDMKKALFEILFFLHVNDEKYAKVVYEATKLVKQGGKYKEVVEEEEACLYVKGAPHGVVGIERMDPLFKEDFQAFLQETFQEELKPKEGFSTFYSIASLGSIGTVGHKVTASDLDLQVQYELDQFLYDESDLTDQKLFEQARQIIQLFARRYAKAKRYKQKDLSNPKVKAEMMTVGKREFKKRFRHLFDFLVAGKQAEVLKQCNDLKFAKSMVHEIIDMVKFFVKHCKKMELLRAEELLQKRVAAIQDYIQKKYPKAEVYLFSYSNDDYRAGKHGTTLESKEASGSAYELILNYDTLMPGIQFTPMIPIHFLMPESVNAAKPMYERLVDYIRFRFTRIYKDYREQLVDLGSTPPLTLDYMNAHSGAVYWESFKASSGNLPKACLNLLRIEMLFDQRFNTSIIELVKNSHKLDAYLGESLDAESGLQDDFDEEEDFFADYGIIQAEADEEEETLGRIDLKGGLPIMELVKIEQDYPFLAIDPWWLRYKALKIAFGPSNKSVADEKERDLVGQIIDLGFALHVKIADIFKVNKPKSLREKVLRRFYIKAFPGIRGETLKKIFAGEVKTVNQFERDLRFVFRRSMDRVQKIVEETGGSDQSNRDEFRIWYHYYQKYFEPGPQVVRQDILTHLKVARGRLQIGFNEKGRRWFFRSIQKGTKLIDAELIELPDEVDLFEHRSILHGLSHCVMNGYYGIYNKGTLLESRTSIEMSVAHMKLGKDTSDKYCFITPDMVVRLINKIDECFPVQDYDYRDCIYKQSEVVDVFVCLNLLEYGNLDILFRTNMKVWAVESFYHPEVEKIANDLHGKPELLFLHPKLLGTLVKFFGKHKFALTEENAKQVTLWVNPNSVVAPGSRPQQKEEYLAKAYKKAVMERLWEKPEPEEAEASEPPEAKTEEAPSEGNSSQAPEGEQAQAPQGGGTEGEGAQAVEATASEESR